MMKLLKKHSILGIIILLVLFVGGLVIASNMGFKLVYTLYTTGASAISGTNWMTVPMNSPLSNASELKADIPNCTTVTTHVKVDDTYDSYTGGRGSVNFTIVPGVAYIVKVSTDTNYVIVGSHDPSFAIPLEATGANAISGTNWISVPYHATCSNASELKSDIPNCTTVTKHVKVDDTYDSYTGGRGSVNFSIVAGEGYIAKVSTYTDWTPSHY